MFLSMNVLVLSFVGDSVFSLFVREKMATKALKKINDLHNQCAIIVSATYQSKLAHMLLPLFDEKENNIYMRARNCKSNSKAKNSSIIDYRKATGFEAVLGYLYLAQERERLDFLLGECEKIFMSEEL